MYKEGYMRKLIMLLIAVFLQGCVSFEDVPTSTPIHDEFITVVESDVSLGNQTLYKNEKLKHYKIDGVDAYCSEMFSMNMDLYRCFSIEGNLLTQGLNPKTSKWERLKSKVKVIKKPL